MFEQRIIYINEYTQKIGKKSTHNNIATNQLLPKIPWCRIQIGRSKKKQLIATNKPTNFAAAASPSLGAGPSPELSSAGSTDAGVGFASRSVTAFR